MNVFSQFTSHSQKVVEGIRLFFDLSLPSLQDLKQNHREEKSGYYTLSIKDVPGNSSFAVVVDLIRLRQVTDIVGES